MRRRAVLSHASAAALWKIRPLYRGPFDVSVPGGSYPRAPRILVHRRRNLQPADIRRHRGIPVTSPICTIVDIAPALERGELEAAINEADIRGLTNPDKIRRALGDMPRRPGVAAVRTTLDHRTFRFTRSQLERHFLPLARRAGLPRPLTRQTVNDFEVDFYRPDLGLVVETDGLTYHRTPAQQAEDRIRDQTHTAAGLTPLRFTHAQIKYEPEYVQRILTEVAGRLRGGAKQGLIPTP